MDFVEDHYRLRVLAAKQLRVAHHFLDDGQVAVHVVDAGFAELLREGGLSRTPDAAEPDNGRFLPSSFDSLQPKRAVNHASAVCVWPDYL